MKNIRLLVVVLVSIMMINVNAVSSDASISSSLTEYSCSSFQDDNMFISGDTYFGRCMQATCDGNKCNLRYYSTNSVSCSNGNLNPYVKTTKTGCSNYQNKSCNSNAVKYCTTISYFDCNRTSNGSKYTTTTKRGTNKPQSTTTTSSTTTAVITEPAKDGNTNLASLVLSNGVINFNKDVKEYSIEVESTILSINVQATPESSTSKVDVQGNNNLVAGSNKITITVTAEDGTVGTYIINVSKKGDLSNNANLASLTVEGHNLDFKSDQYTYLLKTNAESLNIIAETEDENAIYMVEGSNNLKNNSVVKVVVTAADGKTMQEYSITIRKSSGSSGIITVVFIVILLAAVGGGAFYFWSRKKNGGNKEYEYE